MNLLDEINEQAKERFKKHRVIREIKVTTQMFNYIRIAIPEVKEGINNTEHYGAVPLRIDDNLKEKEGYKVIWEE